MSIAPLVILLAPPVALFALLWVLCALSGRRARVLEDRNLAWLMVPAADDPKWRIYSSRSAEYGPFRIEDNGDHFSRLCFCDEEIRAASARGLHRRFVDICRAQGYAPPKPMSAKESESNAKRIARERNEDAQRLRPAILAWHRANEPKAPPPDSDELLERPFR